MNGREGAVASAGREEQWRTQGECGENGNLGLGVMEKVEQVR